MQVSKRGNSLAVRLPATVVDARGHRDGDDIEIQVGGALGGVVSVQVRNAFASVASRKRKRSWAGIGEVPGTIRAIRTVVPLPLETHQRGLALCERYGFSVYDGMILAAALQSNGEILLTEDLQHG